MTHAAYQVSYCCYGWVEMHGFGRVHSFWHKQQAAHGPGQRHTQPTRWVAVKLCQHYELHTEHLPML
jgi:hypothetical protein